ncbi:hypothetical protein GQ53DRAFT_753946 [Thozetella sp. PMI_491]|nr:hypothetical protein GQ53DRAFT_753946 [Thozetella sp. PMI_491]
MSHPSIPPRPQTPQVLLHRLPDRPDGESERTRKPLKYIILIAGSTAVAGKVQIAQSVANALSCPLFQGDSLHESSAKAASLGASRSTTAAAAGSGGNGGNGDEQDLRGASSFSRPNEARYQRMWLSKMTRTGLLFPEESRPATEGFSGFGGTTSTSTSRRGSASSVASASSAAPLSSSLASSRRDSVSSSGNPLPQVASTIPVDKPVLNPVFTLSERERLRRANPALMVLTHPELEPWHKLAIRNAVGEYGIGIIFVPLYEEQATDEVGGEDQEDLPVLRPLDPKTMTEFPTSFDDFCRRPTPAPSLDVEMKIRIRLDFDVDGKITEIIDGANDLMGVDH